MTTKTKTKIAPNTYRETVRYNSGAGKSVVYSPGLFLRNVKSVTTWDNKGKKK